MNQGDSNKKPFVHYLAVWGCISTAIVYAAIGVIAILSYLKIKKGGADEHQFPEILGHMETSCQQLDTVIKKVVEKSASVEPPSSS